MAIGHLWLGLLSSVVVFAVCLTGSIYAFKNPVIELYNRHKVYVDAPKQAVPLPLDTLQAIFERRGSSITALVLPAAKNKSISISYLNHESGILKTSYFNPYTAEELGHSSRSMDGFFQVVLNIHRTLLITKIGKQVVGISILIFVFMLLSGLVLWLPARWKWKNIKAGLTINWRAKFYRINYDLHNTLGFYSLLLLLFIALTGLYVTYPWMKSGILVALGGKPISGEAVKEEISNNFELLLQEMMEKEEEKKTMKDLRPISLDSLMGLVDQKLHYHATTIIQLPDDKEPRFSIQKINTTNWLGAMLPDQISFDKKGELKAVELFRDKPLHKQFVAISLPLHTGEFLGLPGIILYALVSLVGCSLPITGFIIWWKKVR
ncbi:PepSY-associated TM helix domain-containing protein [Eisenibacter elegans]|uniref:PepSY-associated TM helix domain-containing protein n=1 Tax=Eisenibacter elegans TaxID=997 RepID=UPI0004007F96|nr:PepSY-associated TM helix domain-containing protein [Eisenibacter elegans]